MTIELRMYERRGSNFRLTLQTLDVATHSRCSDIGEARIRQILSEALVKLQEQAAPEKGASA